MPSKFADYELVGSYNNQRFPNIDAERSINLFEYIDPKGKKPRSLISTSGILDTNITFPNTTATDGVRAEFVLNNFEYLVVGPNIYRRDTNNLITQLNSTPLPTNTGYVGIEANNNPNGSQILFVDGQIGCIWDTATNQFTYDIANALALPGNTALDPGFPLHPVDVCFIDGFLLVANGGTNTFQLSGLNDAYSWSGVSNVFIADSTTDELTVSTNYATGMQVEVSTTGTLPNPLVINTTYYAIRVDNTHIHLATSYANAVANIFIDITTNGTPVNTITNYTDGSASILQLGAINSHPGFIVGCRTLHRRVFLFSNNYTEVWEDAGVGTNLPLRRNNALLMEYGTPAVGSIVAGFDKLMFLAQDKDGLGSVMMVVGTESIPVSNRALDFQLAQYAEVQQIADARGIFVKENGIIFYRLNFTEANHTYVYNVTLSNPTQEEGKLWHEEQILNGDRHPAQTHGYFNGNNYYGAYNKPVLYQVDNAFTTNDGEIIPRIRIGQAVVPATYNRTRIDRFMVDIIQGLPDLISMSGEIELLTETELDIDTETGVPLLLESSSGSPIYNPNDHVIYLSYSKDGGVSYGYRQRAMVAGMGKRTKRTVWRKLGVVPRGQAYVPKVEYFSRSQLVILGAAWAYEVMPE